MEAVIIGSNGSDDGIPRRDRRQACLPPVQFRTEYIMPTVGEASASYSRTKIWDVIFHWPSGWCSHNLTVLPEIEVVSPPFTNKAVKWEVT